MNLEKNIYYGRYIPPTLKKTKGVIFIGEKPSLYYKKHSELLYLGNYNSPTRPDQELQKRISKYLKGSVFITDMVKSPGKPGDDFVSQWNRNKKWKLLLKKDLKKLTRTIVVVMSRKAEELFKKSFPEYEKVFYFLQPSYAVRYNHLQEWDKQFKELAKKLTDLAV